MSINVELNRITAHAVPITPAKTNVSSSPASVEPFEPEKDKFCSPNDKMTHLFRERKVIDSKGFWCVDPSIFVPVPYFNQNLINFIWEFLNQSVSYVLYLDPETIEKAKNFFISNEYQGDKRHLDKFFNLPFMSNKEKNHLQYFVTPGKFYSKLYALAKQLTAQVSLEMVGGHARKTVFHKTATEKSWAERFLECLPGDVFKEVPQAINERLEKNPIDSDTRINLPELDIQDLAMLSRAVISLIAEEIKEQYSIAEPNFTQIKNFLEVFIQKFCFAKFWKTREDSEAKTVYSVASLGRTHMNQTNKTLELIFVKRLERPCMFVLDNIRIPLTNFIQYYRQESSLIAQKPTIGGLKAIADGQSILDNYTYILHCPDRDKLNEDIFYAGVFHQTKGARYFEDDVEQDLLEKALESSLIPNQLSKKYDAKKVPIQITHQLKKYYAAHGRNNLKVLFAATLRVCASLRKYQSKIPRSCIQAIWDLMEPEFRKFPMNSDQNEFFFICLKTLRSVKMLSLETLDNLIQMGAFLRRSSPCDSQTKVYLTRDGSKPSFQVADEFHYFTGCQVNAAYTDFLQKTEGLGAHQQLFLKEIYNALRPTHPYDFNGSSTIKNCRDHLGIDLNRLEESAIKYLNSPSVFLSYLGWDSLMAWAHHVENRSYAAILLKHVGTLFAYEKNPNERRRLIKNMENLILKENGLPHDTLIFKTMANLVKDPKCNPAAIQEALIEDLACSGLPALMGEALAEWKVLPAKDKKKIGLHLLQLPAIDKGWATHAFRLLQAEKLATFAELKPIFETICSALLNDPQHLIPLQGLALDFIESKSGDGVDLSLSIKNLVQKLITKEKFTLAHELLRVGLKKRMLSSEIQEIQSWWLSLCSFYLQDHSPLKAVECWREAREKGLQDADTPEHVNVLQGIVERLTNSKDKNLDAVARSFIALLVTKTLSKQTREALSLYIVNYLENRIAQNNGLKIDNEIDKFRNLIDENTLFAIKLRVLEQKLEGDLPSNVTELIIQLLDAANDLPDESAALKPALRVVKKLINKMNLQKASRLLNHKKVAAHLNREQAQKRAFVCQFLEKVNSPTDINLGQPLVLDLLETSTESLSEEEVKVLLIYLQKAFEERSDSTSSFALKLKPFAHRILKDAAGCNCYSEAWGFVCDLLNKKIDLEYTEEAAITLFAMGAKLLGDTKNIGLLHQGFSALKWFKDTGKVPELQKTFYCDLVGVLLDQGQYENGFLWIKRLCLNFPEQLGPEVLEKWAVVLLAANQFELGVKLFDCVKESHAFDRHVAQQFFWTFLSRLRDCSNAQAETLLTNNSKVFGRVEPKAQELELVKSIYMKALAACPGAQLGSLVDRLISFNIKDKAILNKLFELRVENVIWQYWTFISSSLIESENNKYTLELIELQLQTKKNVHKTLELAVGMPSIAHKVLEFILKDCWSSFTKNPIDKFSCEHLFKLIRLDGSVDHKYTLKAIQFCIQSDNVEVITATCEFALTIRWPEPFLYPVLYLMIGRMKACPSHIHEGVFKLLRSVASGNIEINKLQPILYEINHFPIKKYRNLFDVACWITENVSNPDLAFLNELEVLFFDLSYIVEYHVILLEMIKKNPCFQIFSPLAIARIKQGMAFGLIKYSQVGLKQGIFLEEYIALAGDIINEDLGGELEYILIDEYNNLLVSILFDFGNPHLFNKYMLRVDKCLADFLPTIKEKIALAPCSPIEFCGSIQTLVAEYESIVVGLVKAQKEELRAKLSENKIYAHVNLIEKLARSSFNKDIFDFSYLPFLHGLLNYTLVHCQINVNYKKQVAKFVIGKSVTEFNIVSKLATTFYNFVFNQGRGSSLVLDVSAPTLMGQANLFFNLGVIDEELLVMVSFLTNIPHNRPISESQELTIALKTVRTIFNLQNKKFSLLTLPIIHRIITNQEWLCLNSRNDLFAHSNLVLKPVTDFPFNKILLINKGDSYPKIDNECDNNPDALYVFEAYYLMITNQLDTASDEHVWKNPKYFEQVGLFLSAWGDTFHKILAKVPKQTGDIPYRATLTAFKMLHQFLGYDKALKREPQLSSFLLYIRALIKIVQKIDQSKYDMMKVLKAFDIFKFLSTPGKEKVTATLAYAVVMDVYVFYEIIEDTNPEIAEHKKLIESFCLTKVAQLVKSDKFKILSEDFTRRLIQRNELIVNIDNSKPGDVFF